MKTFVLLLALLFVAPVFADSHQLEHKGSGHDSALLKQWHETEAQATRLMLEATVILVDQRIQIEEQLDKDPGNKELRTAYKRARANEKRSFEILKQYLKRYLLLE